MTAPRVLAAVDFSDASARAVTVVGFLSRACHGRLPLLHAESMDAPHYFTSEQLNRLERERRASRALGFARALAARCGTTVFDERGTPLEQALQRGRASLAVVPAAQPENGHGTGSYAELVVRCCAAPALVIPESSEGAMS